MKVDRDKGCSCFSTEDTVDTVGLQEASPCRLWSPRLLRTWHGSRLAPRQSQQAIIVPVANNMLTLVDFLVYYMPIQLPAICCPMLARMPLQVQCTPQPFAHLALAYLQPNTRQAMRWWYDASKIGTLLEHCGNDHHAKPLLTVCRCQYEHRRICHLSGC